MLKDLRYIKEFVLGDFKKEVDGKSAPHNATSARAKELKTFIRKITDTGEMQFDTTAATTTGRNFWSQKIQLADWDFVIGLPDKDLNAQDRAHMALFGDLQVHCNCPAFLYWGYAYIATQLDFNVGKGETRPPDIRNPKREGVGCKHIASVIKVLPFHISDVAKVIKKFI